MWLTRFAISRPIITAMLFIGLAVYGALSYSRLGSSAQPNVAFPVVIVFAGYPGASPQEMEKLVIKPIEDQLDGLENLDQLRATAQEGVATVVVQFKLDTNLDFAAIDVQRRVDTARIYMPSDLDPPQVVKNGADDPILTYALSSKSLNGAALGDLVNDRLIPEIKAIPGVTGVDSRGDAAREIQVYPDPLRMMAVGATLPDIYNSVSQNNASLPGGRLDAPTKETSVSIHADIVNPADITMIPMNVPGQKIVRIGDVAAVVDGHKEQRRITHFNGRSGVILDISRNVASDEIKTTKVARAAMKDIIARYPTVNFKEIDAPADFTQAQLTGVLQSLFEGIVLTAIVLMFFLHAWRNAVVVMLAIPSSLLATFIVMKLLNFNLDNISLMGLSLTIGILVDDSIVVLENITRHRDLGQNPLDAAISGRSEIGGAAIAITLVDVVVFLPMAFLSGFVGKYMKEFGVVVVVATLFSLFVSFTLTPMLAAKWSVLKRSSAPPKFLEWFQSGFDALTRWYRDRALGWALRRGWFIGVGCFALFVGSIAMIATGMVPSEFIPEMESGSIAMSVTYPTGTPLHVTQDGIDRIETYALTLPGVDRVFSTTGAKPSGRGSLIGGNLGRVQIQMADERRKETNATIATLRGNVAKLAKGALVIVGSRGGGGSGVAISYDLSGPDSELDASANKLADFIRSVKGTINVQTGAESAAPRLNIHIDPRRAMALGVSPGSAATAARTALGGAVATKVRTASGLVDVRVELPASYRTSIDNVKRVHIRAQDGSIVNLEDVADFTEGLAPTKIERSSRQRIISVSADVDRAQGSLGAITAQINAKVDQPGFLASGVHTFVQGDSQLQGETNAAFGISVLTSIALVYMLLVILYGSFLTPFVIMFSVPVALVGAVIALWISHQSLNLLSDIGLIMLMGLVAKNGILLVDYANTMRKRGMNPHDAMLAAAGTRLRPIVMTTAAMVFGMLPLALGLAEGAEFRRSMGVVLIGGLISSLILTLFLVPVVYTTMLCIQSGIGRRFRKTEPALELPREVAIPAGTMGD